MEVLLNLTEATRRLSFKLNRMVVDLILSKYDSIKTRFGFLKKHLRQHFNILKLYKFIKISHYM
jgi:hypothetical protein